MGLVARAMEIAPKLDDTRTCTSGFTDVTGSAAQAMGTWPWARGLNRKFLACHTKAVAYSLSQWVDVIDQATQAMDPWPLFLMCRLWLQLHRQWTRGLSLGVLLTLYRLQWLYVIGPAAQAMDTWP